jgi:ribonuclease T1
MMRWLLAGLMMLFCLGAQAHGHHAHHAHHEAGQAAIASISVDQLPPEGRDTLEAIRRGGPFAYERDGVVFGNFERVLPVRPRGYYHEYTVKTPGARNRGARRLISGATNEYYYTADHYQTFQRIQE